jgi:uncharacterized protein (TIGR02147 family)
MRDYRNILRQELSKRLQRNPRYSQSAFARDIGLPANRLSEVLGGKQGLSRRSATIVAERLALPTAVREEFLDMVDTMHARSGAQRQAAANRLKTAKTVPIAKPALNSWYHLVLVELDRIGVLHIASEKRLAARLQISESALRQALTDLKAEGLIGAESSASGATPPDVPSTTVRAFHEKILALANTKLHEIPVSEREYNSFVLPMRKDRVQEFKTELRRFLHGFADAADATPNPDAVYICSAQFFPMLDLEEL